MTGTGINIISENKAGFLQELRDKGYSKQRFEVHRKALLWFIEFLKTRKKLSKERVFQVRIIDEFMDWKIRCRQKKNYHPTSRKRLAMDINQFLDWYFRYQRSILEKQVGIYLSEQTFTYARKSIEVKNELSAFFNYLDRYQIKNLRRITPHMIDDFIREKEKAFYKKRTKYSTGHSEISLKSAIRNYYRYLNRKGLSSTKIPLKPVKKERHLFFEQVIMSYLDFCKKSRGLKKSSLWQIHHTLKQLDWFLQKNGGSKLNQIRITDLDRFVNATYPKTKLRAIHGANHVLRGFFQYLYFTGEIKKDPSRYLIAAPIYRLSDVPKHFKSEEIKTILSAIDKSQPDGLRKYAIISLLLFNGLRSGEVANLTLDDIDWEEKRIVVRNRKNITPLLTVLSDGTLEAIKNYVLKVRPHDRKERNIFFTEAAPIRPMSSGAIGIMISRLLKQLSIQGSAHSFRHTFGQLLLESGSSLEEAQSLLGHNAIGSTRIYTKSSLSRMRKYVVSESI